LEISHMHVLHPTLQVQFSLISKAQMEFWSTWQMILMQKYFQPLLIRLCFNYGNGIFESMNILVHFLKSIKFALHELSLHDLHIQITFVIVQLANPSGIGPSMRLYRPMHGGPFHPCNALFMHSALLSSINTMPMPLISVT
jgi:hypothetical protein